ncbi:MAG: ParB N-terminal domain-containing protein [bacterium]|nr:ParB N-terminal domain-containing protein [bacterium]
MSKKFESTVELDLLLVDADLFVRTALNEDWVVTLADLVQAGTELPPIVVVSVGERFRVVDGRHRKAAYELCGKDKILVQLTEVPGGEIGLISASYKANVGGSLPPTKDDTEHTIEALLDAGATKKNIGQLLNLPASLARKYVDSVENRIKRRRVNKAALAVATESLTIPQAAQIHNIDVDDLKTRLGVKPGRKKKIIDFASDGLVQCRKRHRGLSSSRGRFLAELVKLVSDGEVVPQRAIDIFDDLQKQVKGDLRLIEDWRKRLNVRVNGEAT